MERPDVRDVHHGAVRLYSYGGRTTYTAAPPIVPTDDIDADAGTVPTPLFDALRAERYGRL